jgi:hypothetical protein
MYAMELLGPVLTKCSDTSNCIVESKSKHKDHLLRKMNCSGERETKGEEIEPSPERANQLWPNIMRNFSQTSILAFPR